MNLNAFAQAIHQNAIAHGWWDAPRDLDEIVALICSEWSEALEEYRAGRPMEWYHCCECQPDGHGHPCDPKDENDCLNYETREKCPHRGKKPEGIAVELIDGCIRILDYLASANLKPIEHDVLPGKDYCIHYHVGLDLPHFVAQLHAETVTAWRNELRDGGCTTFSHLIFSVFEWIRNHGLDPEAVMLEKHDYNKTRPYKHGKIF